jgi:hypothetical protein
MSRRPCCLNSELNVRCGTSKLVAPEPSQMMKRRLAAENKLGAEDDSRRPNRARGASCSYTEASAVGIQAIVTHGQLSVKFTTQSTP